MKREFLKTGMRMWNSFYEEEECRLLYIVESNEKYIECLGVYRNVIKTFRTGSGWDQMMQNYEVVSNDIYFALLFGDLNK